MDYRALASQIAAEEGVPADLFLKLVNQESRFRPDARSPKGAMGLAQLMPGTAQELGVDPSDPVQNLRGGARYLRQQLNTFGDPALALAAYNAGPGAVRKYGGIPPFRETQNYVSTILGGGAPAPSARVSTQGGQQMAMMEQQPRGLLDALGIQRRDPNAQGETALPFYQRESFGNTLENLQLGLNRMTLRPDPNLAASIGQQREARAASKAANRTAAYLESIGRGDLAAAMMSGGLDAKSAMASALTPAADDRTAMVKNYEYWLSTGRSPEEAAEMARAGAGGSVINMPSDAVKVLPDGSVLVLDPSTPDGFRVVQPPGSKAATEAGAATSQQAALADSAADTIALIDSIANDPALPSITGMVQGRMPPMTQAGTNLSVKIEQLQGQAFLRAFESLKGGGAITEKEGLAAQNAMARLQRVQDEASYRASLNELKTILDRGRQRALAGARAQDGDQFSGGGGAGGVQVGDPY